MRFELRFESLKSISDLILFVYKLMIGSSAFEQLGPGIQNGGLLHRKTTSYYLRKPDAVVIGTLLSAVSPLTYKRR